MLTRTLFLSIAAIVATTAPKASASLLFPATDYNVFVFGDMTQSSDSQGAIAVGGNATFSSYSVATNAPASNTNLVVGGNLIASYGTINGNAFVGGNVNYNDPSINGSLTSNGNINFGSSGGSISSTASYTGTYTGPSYISHTHITSPVSSPVNFPFAHMNLEITASGLASVPTTGTTSIAWGAVTLSGNASTNFFNLSALQLEDASSISINIPTGTDAIINVTGGDGTITLPNVDFNFDPAHTLWNLAAFNTVTNSSFSGSVLAPNADVTFNSGVFTGTLIAKSLAGGGQFDQSPFTNNYPFDNVTPGSAAPNIAAPEPASLATLALSALLLLKRRRHP